MVEKPIFSVSQFTTWHQSFEQDIELYRRLGVEGIEICERKLSRDDGRAREQLAMVRDSGLTVTSVQPRVHALFPDFMCPNVDDPDERMARFRRTIDFFSEAFPGQDIPFVTITGNAPGMNFQAAHRIARAQYPQLADHAGDRGVRIMFEPLSVVLMNNDTFICTLDESMRLVEDVDSESFGVMFDIWHLWREPSVGTRLRDIGGRIFGVHISDWPEGEPRHPADRRVCGEGVIDLPGLLGALHAAGYRDAYCLEIFSLDELPDSLWQTDPADVIHRSRRGFELAWEAMTCD